MKKNNWRNFWVVTFGCFFVFALIFIWIFFIGLKADKTGSVYNKGNNAVWLAHEWAEEFKSDAGVHKLIANLHKHDINTIFLHVGPLKEDGSIDPETYRAAVSFVSKVDKYGEDMKVFAWMGQLRSKLNLSDASVRHNILNMCLIFTKMIGMEGVHYDIEPVWDEDEDFIALLRETREFIDEEKFVSVALAEFIPSSFVWWVENVANFKNYNTEVNYLNVAKYADQIVDMVYDTGIDRGWLYKWLVKEQVIWVSDLMDHEEAFGTELLIGIPSYDDNKDGFDPEVENIENALLGILNGLNDIRSSEENFSGIAVYSEWETSDEEWAIYDGLWL